MELPAYKPYTAHECDILSELEEIPEKEHAHIDYTAARPHISIVTEDKLFYKRDLKKISFDEAEIKLGLDVNDDSSLDSELFYRPDVMRMENSYDGDTEMDRSEMSLQGRGK